MATMRTVLLPGFDKPCSALGFGCANLMGRVSLRQSERALAYAFDCGVTFFDTSRSYGWGRSEEVLGAFAKGKRDKILICTKFGTLPPPRNRLREWAKPVVRGSLKLVRKIGLAGVGKRIAVQVANHSASVVRKGCFDVDAAQRSLDTSLRELKTDYIDIYLLHNPEPANVADGAVFEYLETLVSKGTIRTFGVSSNPESARVICTRFADIRTVQIPNNILDDNIWMLPRREAKILLTNVPFGSGAGLAKVRSLASTNTKLIHRCQAELGLDLHTDRGTASLCLRAALSRNSSGVVICGMHNLDRIAANVADAQFGDNTDLDRIAESIRRTLNCNSGGL